MTFNHRQLNVMRRSLEELSAITSLDAGQQALLGDIRRALGIQTTIRATLGEGNITYLPVRVGEDAINHGDETARHVAGGHV